MWGYFLHWVQVWYDPDRMGHPPGRDWVIPEKEPWGQGRLQVLSTKAGDFFQGTCKTFNWQNFQCLMQFFFLIVQQKTWWIYINHWKHGNRYHTNLIESNPVNIIMVTNIVFLVVNFWNVAYYQCKLVLHLSVGCSVDLSPKWFLLMAISFDPFVWKLLNVV